MSPKRGDEVPPPAVGDEWRLRFATNEAAKGWGDLCAAAPGNTRRCYEALRRDPTSEPLPEAGPCGTPPGPDLAVCRPRLQDSAMSR